MQPMTVSGKTKLTSQPWPEHSSDEHILLNSDVLLTVCEPTEQVRDAYLKKIGKTMHDMNREPEQVLLTEDETPPEGEDYEPRYVEEPLY